MNNEKNRIEIGDVVKVLYCKVEGLPDFDGFVEYIPQSTGDMWHIKTEKQIIVINPACSSLIGFFKNVE